MKMKRRKKRLLLSWTVRTENRDLNVQNLKSDTSWIAFEPVKKPYTSGETALQSLRIIWALYEAEKQGVMAELRGMGIPDRDELRKNLVF